MYFCSRNLNSLFMNFSIRTFLLIVGTVFTACLESHAQMDSLVYGVQKVGINPEQKGELRASIEAMPFVRDNEYKSELVKGYTLPGVWLDPTLSYQPLKNLKIEIGAHMLHFWGAKKYPNFNYSKLASWDGKNVQNGFHCVPIFRAHMQLTPQFNVIVGTLYGKSNHGLITPLYNEELNLSGDPETGVQFILDTRPVKLDAWINWESFIFNNDNHQESFSFGLSTRFRPSKSTARWQWYIPVQGVFQHRGGEVNYASEDRTIKTWLNAAAGVGVDIPLDTKIRTKLNFEATGSYFGQQAGNLLPFDKGYGFYGKASAQVWRMECSLGYWYCKDFVSIFGNPLFGAMSISNENMIYNKPSSLTASIRYSQELGKGFAWGIHADMLNQFAADTHTPETGWVHSKGTMNFAAGIYLRVNPSFLIKKF